MRLYFDTNIYDFITKFGRAEDVRAQLDHRGHVVEASGMNLVEIWRIPDYRVRRKQVETVATIAREFERVPHSYLEAQEVLSELRRCRPAWVRRFISRDDKRNIRHFLNSQRKSWKDAKQDPGVGGERINAYLRAASTTDPDGQRRVRQAVLQYRQPLQGFQMYSADPEYREVTKSFGPAEFFWRQSALVEWQAAIAQRVSAVRDLRDWAGPYLTELAFRGRQQMEFWYLEADGLRLPITRMKGLVAYYQLQRRITPGNPHEVEHSLQELTCDIFLTADNSFHLSLTSARSHFQQAAPICFVDKKRGDPCTAIIDSIEQCIATSSDGG